MDSELLAVVIMTENEFTEYLRSRRMTESERTAYREHMHDKYGIPVQRKCDHFTPEEMLESHSAHHGYHECEH